MPTNLPPDFFNAERRFREAESTEEKIACLEELAGRIHKDHLHNLKSARIWGSGAFDGQMVTREHVLQDGDIVELKI